MSELIEFRSLGGFKCRVLIDGAPDQRHSVFLGCESILEGKHFVLVFPLSSSELEDVGRLSQLSVQTSSGWMGIKRLTPNELSARTFVMRWNDQDIDLGDLKTRLRLRIFFRSKFGRTVPIHLYQLSLGLIQVDLSTGSWSPEESLRLCLGLLP